MAMRDKHAEKQETMYRKTVRKAKAGTLVLK